MYGLIKSLFRLHCRHKFVREWIRSLLSIRLSDPTFAATIAFLREEVKKVSKCGKNARLPSKEGYRAVLRLGRKRSGIDSIHYSYASLQIHGHLRWEGIGQLSKGSQFHLVLYIIIKSSCLLWAWMCSSFFQKGHIPATMPPILFYGISPLNWAYSLYSLPALLPRTSIPVRNS